MDTENKIKDYIDELRNIHDKIKNSPYWIDFNHENFTEEIYHLYRKILEIYSALRYDKEYNNNDSPFFAIIYTIYHDFNAALCRMHVLQLEDTDDFKRFYLPMLQNFLQLVHFFIDGLNNPDIMVMYMPTLSEKKMIKYKPVYHENWIFDDGYDPWILNFKWRALQTIKENEIDKYIDIYTSLLNQSTKEYHKQCYIHLIKDLKDKTQLLVCIE